MKISDQAMTIYKAYPKHVGRPKALAGIGRALKREPYESLLRKTQEYAKRVKQLRGTDDWQFVPYPATWFNQDRWADVDDNLFLKANPARTIMPGISQKDLDYQQRQRENRESAERNEREREAAAKFCREWAELNPMGYSDARAAFLKESSKTHADYCRRDEPHFMWNLWQKHKPA